MGIKLGQTIRFARLAWADAFDIGASIKLEVNVRWLYQLSFASPESITAVIPSIVTEVSAMFVEITTFVLPFGASSKTLSCSSLPNLP